MIRYARCECAVFNGVGHEMPCFAGYLAIGWLVDAVRNATRANPNPHFQASATVGGIAMARAYYTCGAAGKASSHHARPRPPLAAAHSSSTLRNTRSASAIDCMPRMRRAICVPDKTRGQYKGAKKERGCEMRNSIVHSARATKQIANPTLTSQRKSCFLF